MTVNDLSPIGKFFVKNTWAWKPFKYLVLPLYAVWVIARDKLPEIIAEYRADVAYAEKLILDASTAIKPKTPAPLS
jgi:hypothetical protein